MRFIEFFEEAGTKKLSWIRLAGTLCVLTGLFISVLMAFKVYYLEPKEIAGTVLPLDMGFMTPMTVLVLALISLGMGIKTFQKSKEYEVTVENPAGQTVQLREKTN